MKTISERLLSPDVQAATLENIVAALRERGEWKDIGHFHTLGGDIGVNPAYLRRLLTGAAPLTLNFVQRIGNHLKVSYHSLLPRDRKPIECVQQAIESIAPGLEFSQRVKLAARVREFIKTELSV